MNRSLVRTVQIDCKYVFVDWAGDPGFRFRDGSSQHFIVVAVFTGDYGLMRQRLALLRQQRQLSADFHFHYADVPRRVAQAFFEAVQDVPFSSRVTVLNKAVLPDPWRRMPGQWMIEHFVARTIMGARAEWVEDAVLIFDGPDGRRRRYTGYGLRSPICSRSADWLTG